MYKTIGIIGGMGPAATVDLFDRIVRLTAAADDQHHIPILIDNNTRIPDRTRAIIADEDSPLPEILRSGRRLLAAGADFLIMPCNTAHYYFDEITAALGAPLLNMLQLTAERLRRDHVRRAAVLATDGTLATGIYEQALEAAGVEAMRPTAAEQRQIMSLIYDYVKSGILDRGRLPETGTRAVAAALRERGAERLILGCTELPPAFHAMEMEVGCVDPTRLLAEAAIRTAGAEVRADEPCPR